MAATIGGCSAPQNVNENPIIVRVKRKASQHCPEALWLEISGRPLKRPLLDFKNLSISETSGKVLEEARTKTILVRHVETVSSSDATFEILQSFMPDSADASNIKTKGEERRRTAKKENTIQDQLLLKARQEQEGLAKTARFEQIWRRRKGRVGDNASQEACHFYDVVRVDVGGTSNKTPEQENLSLEDSMVLQNYLPLLREFLPSAAEEVESDIYGYMSKRGYSGSVDDYVYDLYTVKDDVDMADENDVNSFPLVHVDDEENFYDGPDYSDYESDDSNAEDNPCNDYPDEESSENEVVESETSDDESEEPRSEGSDDGCEFGLDDDDHSYDACTYYAYRDDCEVGRGRLSL